MKTYENLTKLEREKLATYQRYCIITNINLLVFSMFGLTVSLIGACMITLFVSIVSVMVGIYLMFIGITVIVMILFITFKQKKEMFLVFGYKDSMRELFKIKLSDIKNVVIEHKTTWRKK